MSTYPFVSTFYDIYELKKAIAARMQCGNFVRQYYIHSEFGLCFDDLVFCSDNLFRIVKDMKNNPELVTLCYYNSEAALEYRDECLDRPYASCSAIYGNVCYMLYLSSPSVKPAIRSEN